MWSSAPVFRTYGASTSSTFTIDVGVKVYTIQNYSHGSQRRMGPSFANVVVSRVVGSKVLLVTASAPSSPFTTSCATWSLRGGRRAWYQVSSLSSVAEESIFLFRNLSSYPSTYVANGKETCSSVSKTPAVSCQSSTGYTFPSKVGGIGILPFPEMLSGFAIP